MRDPIVYVVQKPFRDDIDLTPALDFGSIEYVLDDNRQIAGDSTRALQKMAFVLQRYTPEDYLLAIGDPVAIGLACCLAARQTGGVFQILKWDRIDQRYYPTFVNLNRTK